MRIHISLKSPTLWVFVSTISLALAMLLGSAIYYNHLNSLEDPRLAKARDLQNLYQQAFEEQQFEKALKILDAWQNEYSSLPAYHDSFEAGVLLNNRGSIYLIKFETEVLTATKADFAPPYHYLIKAEKHLQEAISLYEAWSLQYGHLSTKQLNTYVAPYFTTMDPELGDYNREKLIQRRIEKLEAAQIETPRRISVSLTNLGVIKRYQGKLDLSKELYEQAIELWDLNYTAMDNLEILLGNKPQKRTVMDKLFPPEKE